MSLAIMHSCGKLRSEASQLSDMMGQLGKDTESRCTTGSCFQHFSILI